MKTTLYVVTMYRWGNREAHSYVLGVFSTEEKAKEAAKKEKIYRGGNKYYPECLECPIDVRYPEQSGFKKIISLECHPFMAGNKNV